MNAVEARIELTLKLVAEYARLNNHWDTQRKAFLQCVGASQDFLDFIGCDVAHEIGANTYTFTCDNRDPNTTGQNPKPDFYKGTGTKNDEMECEQAPWHCIVQTADFYIDWTAKQYWSYAAYPMIIPRSAYLSMAAAAGSTE